MLLNLINIRGSENSQLFLTQFCLLKQEIIVVNNHSLK